jgi:hypothetical protein
MLTAAVARSPAASGSDAPVMLQLANGFESSPFSALSTAQDVRLLCPLFSHLVQLLASSQTRVVVHQL